MWSAFSGDMEAKENLLYKKETALPESVIITIGARPVVEIHTCDSDIDRAILRS